MKRFVFSAIVMLLLATPLFVSAQRNTVTGTMIIHNTDVIKSKRAKMQYAVADVKKGYQQELSFAYSLMFDTGHMININYVGGYRFNHHFYVGIGTGLDFSTDNNDRFVCYGNYYDGGEQYFRASNIDNIDSAESRIGKEYYRFGWDLPMQTVAVPLYVHLRTYFMKTKWTPFLAFSAGVRFSSSKELYVYDIREEKGNYSWSSPNYYVGDYNQTLEYGAVTGMFEVMPGVSYQHKSGTAFNFQFGFATRGGFYIRDYYPDKEIREGWALGFTMRFGVVF